LAKILAEREGGNEPPRRAYAAFCGWQARLPGTLVPKTVALKKAEGALRPGCRGRSGRNENCGLFPALRCHASALLRLVAAPQIFRSSASCSGDQRSLGQALRLQALCIGNSLQAHEFMSLVIVELLSQALPRLRQSFGGRLGTVA
jgi:hypothetical protein